MRMKWLPAGIGLFLVGMSVVSFADERVYEQAEFPHEICGTWTDIHGGRTLEIAPRAVDGDLLDGRIIKYWCMEISRTTVLPAGILNRWTAYIWEWR